MRGLRSVGSSRTALSPRWSSPLLSSGLLTHSGVGTLSLNSVHSYRVASKFVQGSRHATSASESGSQKGQLEEGRNAQYSNDPKVYQDSTLPDRNDKKWDFLRDIDGLKDKIGETIELPDLGGRKATFPKELNPKKIKQILLTPQRYEILQKFANAVNLGTPNAPNKDPQSGMILSGPSGVGKTVESYLIASTAYVNNSLLIYIPLVSTWTTQQNEEEWARFMLRRFVQFNAILAAGIQCKFTNDWGSSTLLDLALVGLHRVEEAYRVHMALLDELQACIETPVVYVFDEHNEIFRQQLQDTRFFRIYTSSTSGLHGMRAFVLISGSAHSAFEFNLQPGLSRWIVRLQPFPCDLFEKVIKPPDGLFALPQAWQQDQEMIRVLEEATGRFPREIHLLKNAYDEDKVTSPMAWVDERTAVLKHEFLRFRMKPENKPKLSSFNDFLEIILSPRYHPHSSPSAAGQYFFDSGLIYRDAEAEYRYKPISMAAERTVLDYYYDTRKSKAAQLLSKTSGAKQGHLFQECVETALYHGVPLLHAFRLGDNQPVEIFIPRFMLRKFFRVNNVPKNDTGLPCLYVPSVDNYPYWDLVLHDPSLSGSKEATKEATNSNGPKERVIFVQASVNSIRQHDKTSDSEYLIQKSFTLKATPSKPCLVEAVVNGITGRSCTATITDDGSLSVVGEGLEVLFMFITGAQENQIHREEKQMSKEKEPPPKYHNLLVVPRKACKDELGIPFATRQGRQPKRFWAPKQG